MTSTTLPRAIVLSLLLAALPVPASADGPALPDLAPIRLTSWPPEPQFGDIVTFNATVRNDGAAFRAITWVAFVVDGRTVATREVRGMEAQVDVTFTALWSARPGDHRVEVVADWNGTVAESDEADNLLGLDFSVRRPDLVVLSADVRITDHGSPTSGPGYEGDHVSVLARVANVGPGASPGFRLVVRHDGEVVLDAPRPSLKAGQDHIFSVSLPRAVAGTHVLTVDLDPEDSIAETDETNNLLARTSEILPLPVADAKVRILEVARPALHDAAPTVPHPQRGIIVRVEVTNLGPGDLVRSNLSVTMEGTTHGSRTTCCARGPTLAPGGSTVVTLHVLPTGVGDVRLHVRADLRQTDPDLGNNADTAEYAILLPSTGLGVVLE